MISIKTVTLGMILKPRLMSPEFSEPASPVSVGAKRRAWMHGHFRTARTFENEGNQKRRFLISEAENGTDAVFDIRNGDMNPWDVSVANIRVVHDLDTLPATYYGALLESASTLQGASLMSFVTKNKKGDYVNMPKGQWFVGSATAGTKVLK